MQKFLPEIKQLLADWYLLTLENPLYAGVLVLSAWLLTVFYYCFRIYFLNRKQNVAEQASIQLQGRLEEVQQLNKRNGEVLTALTEQLAKEQQLATEFVDKVEERNQLVVGNIKQLASKFDLNEQLISSGESPKAEFIWQQQDNIQLQLTEQLQAERQAKSILEQGYKQEKEQFFNQKALVGQLQKTLDLQIGQFTKIEQELNEQKLMQQQHKNEAQQKLADALADIQAKHKLDVASLENELNLQKEILLVDTKVEKIAGIEAEAKDEVSRQELCEKESQNQSGTLESGVKAQKEERAISSEEPEVVVVEPLVEVPEPVDKTVEVATEVLEPVVVASVEPEVMPEVLVPSQAGRQEEYEPDYTKSNLSLTGKFKSLFGKGNKPANKTKPENLAEKLVAEEVTESEKIEIKPDYSEPSKVVTGKFKKIFGKGKKLADKAKAESPSEVMGVDLRVPEPEKLQVKPDYSESKLDVTGKFNKLFGKGNKQADKTEAGQQTEVMTADVTVSEPEQLPNLDMTGEFQNSLKKEKKQIDAIALKQQAEEVLQTKAFETEPGAQSFEPDYTRSNFKIPTKVKRLFGKS